MEDWRTVELDNYQIRGLNRPKFKEVNKRYARIVRQEEKGLRLFTTDIALFNFCPYRYTLPKILSKTKLKTLRQESGTQASLEYGSQTHSISSLVPKPLKARKNKVTYQIPNIIVLRWNYKTAIITGKPDNLVTTDNKIDYIEEGKTSRHKEWLVYDKTQSNIYCWLAHQITEDPKQIYRLSRLKDTGKIESFIDYDYNQIEAEASIETFYKYKVENSSISLPKDWTLDRCNAGPRGCDYTELCPIRKTLFP